MKSAVDEFLERVRDEDLPDATREDRILASTLSAAGMSSVTPGLTETSKGTSSSTGGGLLGTGAAKVAGLAGIALAVALPLWHFSSQDGPPPHEVSRASSPQPIGSALQIEKPPVVEPAEIPRSAVPRATPMAPFDPRQDEAPLSSKGPPIRHPPAPSALGRSTSERNDSSSTGKESSPILAPSLSEELEVLERVQVALKRNQPREALRLLDDLDGSPALEEERRAARVMASCLANRSPAAVKSAHAFVERHPRSMHREAIERVCEPK